MQKSIYIECGRIVNTHGCRGGLKLESWCDSPGVLSGLKRIFLKKGEHYIQYKVKKSSIFRQFVLFELSGIDDMDKAMALKNTVVYAMREDFGLKDGEYFIADIIGVDVIDADNGKIYGKVSDITNRGASDIYVVETPDGERMIPAVKEFIDRVEPDKGLFVRPIEGLLD